MSSPSNSPASADATNSAPGSPPSTRALVAYVAPFAIYLLITSIEGQGWLGLGYQVWYTLKALLVSTALIWFRGEYPAFSIRGLGLGVLAGVIGIALWLILDRAQGLIPGLNEWVASWMGRRVAVDPFGEDGASAGELAFVCIRLLGLAIVVPVMEEIFWRGFLARYLIREDFSSVPQGVYTPLSFAIVTGAFVALHPELLAATAWGALINLLFQRAQNVWACVVMHAVTNGLLGAWILTTGDWRLW